MSARRYLLLFLGEDTAPGWLRLRDGVVEARGRPGEPPPPADEGADEHVVAVVPAEDVAVHWVDLPALAPAQAVAAARLLAGEASAEPIERLHVALGAAADGAPRAMAVTSADRMAAWLGRAAEFGFDPDMLVPESLLIDPPAEGVRRLRRGDVEIVRGATTAFAAEPELATLAADGTTVEALDEAAFEAGLAGAVGADPLDLRQGLFAKRRRWRVDWGLARRLALLGAGVLVATLLIQIATIARYSVAADRLEREARAVASGALPRAGDIADPQAALAQRLAELQGGGAGFADTAAAAFAAIRDTPGAGLGSLRFAPDGSLQASVRVQGVGDIAALQRRLEAEGFAVTASAPRTEGGRQAADITVRVP